MLSKEDVKHIAKLARVALTDTEVEKFRGQLSQIVDFVSQLKEVNVEGVEPTAQVTGLMDVMRPDVVMECERAVQDKIVESFPEKSGRLLKVPPVFGE